MNKAVFLDLYGTILNETSAVFVLFGFPLTKFTPNAVEGIKLLSDAGYKLIVVSNQAAINSGLISEKRFRGKILHRIEQQLAKSNVKLDKIYYCPHTVKEDCECRKPKTGMLEKAVKEFDINVEKSWIIGDQTCDILAGKKAGCKTILVETGYGSMHGRALYRLYNISPNHVAKELYDAANIILKEK